MEENLNSKNDDLIPTDSSESCRWNDKYQDIDNTSDDESDAESDEEEIVILRCQTTTCHGNKCVPVEFDFVVHVRFGDEENTPQAADTYFPYTMSFKSDKE